MNRSWNIIIVPTDHAGTRQYTVSRALLLWTLGLVAVFLLALGFFLFDYSRTLRGARETGRLQKENVELRTQVAQIDHLNREIEKLTALKAQVMAMLGAEGSVTSEAPTGGVATADSTKERETRAPIGLLGVDHLKAAASIRSTAPTLWPVDGYVSKEFYEKDAQGKAHPGLDLVAPNGAPVHAVGRGKVIEASYDEWLGNVVVIDHGFGYSSLYGHNQRLLVHVGQSVERGQVIALLGNTGRSSAPHLHFEIRVDGKPVDPRQYLQPK